MIGSSLPTMSLYEVLAEPAPPDAGAGETNSTRTKETIDADVEAFTIEELMHGA
jgi:hypothetical protein